MAFDRPQREDGQADRDRRRRRQVDIDGSVRRLIVARKRLAVDRELVMARRQIADLEIAGRVGDEAPLGVGAGNHDSYLTQTRRIALAHSVERVIVEDIAHQP